MEEEIIELINKELGLDITQDNRKQEVVEARALYFHLMKQLHPKKSLQSLGDAFGKNHATVIHALKNYPIYEKYNERLCETKNLVLHLFGVKDAEETIILKFKRRLKELEESKKVRYEIIQQLDDLLTATEGTEQHNLIKLRLEAFYTMNRNIRL